MKKIILLFSILLLLPCVLASNNNQTHPSSEILNDTAFGYGNFRFRDNLTADWFIGNGTRLIDINRRC